MYRYKSREIYYEELAHVITEVSKSKICSVGQQSGEPGELTLWLPSESLLANTLLLRGGQSFCSF